MQTSLQSIARWLTSPNNYSFLKQASNNGILDLVAAFFSLMPQEISKVGNVMLFVAFLGVASFSISRWLDSKRSKHPFTKTTHHPHANLHGAFMTPEETINFFKNLLEKQIDKIVNVSNEFISRIWLVNCELYDDVSSKFNSFLRNLRHSTDMLFQLCLDEIVELFAVVPESHCLIKRMQSFSSNEVLSYFSYTTDTNNVRSRGLTFVIDWVCGQQLLISGGEVIDGHVNGFRFSTDMAEIQKLIGSVTKFGFKYCSR